MSDRSSRRALRTLFAVLGGIALFYALAITALMSHPRTRPALESVWNVGRDFVVGTTGPAADAMRRAGCHQPVVIPIATAVSLSLWMEEDDDLDAETLEADAASRMYAHCGVDYGQPPRCAEVASAYVAEVAGDEPFVVAVHKGSGIACAGWYDAEGDWVGRVGPGFARLP